MTDHKALRKELARQLGKLYDDLDVSRSITVELLSRLKEEPMKPTYYECGICSQLHPATWDGDCRDDANRFNPEDLDAMHGPVGWDEIDMGDVDDWRCQKRADFLWS